MTTSNINDGWILTTNNVKWKKHTEEKRDTNLEFMHNVETFREIHLKNCIKTIENLNKKIHNMTIGLAYHRRALETTKELQVKMTAIVRNSSNRWSEILALYNLLHEIKDGQRILAKNKEFKSLLSNQYHLLVKTKSEVEYNAKINIEKLRIIRIQNSLEIYDCYCH